MTRERKLVVELLREFLAPEGDPIATELRCKREYLEALEARFRRERDEVEEQLRGLDEAPGPLELAEVEERLRKLSTLQKRIEYIR